MSQINLENIGQFLQGNLRKISNDLGDRWGLKFLQLPNYIKEQITYRKSKCPDCLKEKKCINCHCPVPKKWFANKACKEKRFPNLMEQKDWETFKQENNIKIELNEGEDISN